MTLNFVEILVAGIAVFVFAAVYYTVLAPYGARLGAAWAQGRRPPPTLMLLEIVKALVVSAVVAGLVSGIGITHPMGAIELALALWIGFPVVLLVGSITQENVPWRLAAIHAGDWLAKLLIVSVLAALWR
jgi:hypothetical protein